MGHSLLFYFYLPLLGLFQTGKKNRIDLSCLYGFGVCLPHYWICLPLGDTNFMAFRNYRFALKTIFVESAHTIPLVIALIMVAETKERSQKTHGQRPID
jgi:Na+-transporting NADH:ubiquinone oxidoreductase subunit NqrE